MLKPKFAKFVLQLIENDVEAIVVGMLAGILQGVPLTTDDIDIVERRRTSSDCSGC